MTRHWRTVLNVRIRWIQIHTTYVSSEYRPAAHCYIKTTDGKRIPVDENGDYYENSWIDEEESSDEFDKVCNTETYTPWWAVGMLHAGVAGAAFMGLRRKELEQRKQNAR